MKIKSTTSGSVVQFSSPLGLHTSLIVSCRIYQALGQLIDIPRKGNTFFLLWLRGILVHKQYSHQSLSFIFGVPLLPRGLNSTPWSHIGTQTWLRYQRAWSIPRWSYVHHLFVQEAFLFFHLIDFHFFKKNSLFHFFIFITMHSTDSFQRWTRDLELLRVEEVVPIEK